MNLIDEVYEKAVSAVESCVRPVGFYASGLPGGYEGVWARDSMITSVGASLVGDKFKESFTDSLDLLAKNQSEHGQIPNAVGSYNLDRRSDVTYNSIDSSLWYIIGHHIYVKAYKDKNLIGKHKKSIDAALKWVQFQDFNEDDLPAQQPTTDWQDAFPHKYGHAINTQALYYETLKVTGNDKLADHVRDIVNGKKEKYLSLYDEKTGYYLPWNWKNHDGDREQETWFDTLGNLLAIVTGLATKEIASSILHYIDTHSIDDPYPCKAIYPPLEPGGKEWHSYFSKSDSKEPYHYLNAGIWPFIGGFYVAAIIKMGDMKKAEKELERLAEANSEMMDGEHGFHEWLHGQTGKAIGNSNPYQGWTAGTYIFAHHCLKEKKVIYF